MDEILKSVVQLNRLAGNFEPGRKKARQAADLLFDQIVSTENYLNKANAKEIDQLAKAAKEQGDLEFAVGKADAINVKGLKDKGQTKLLLGREEKSHKLYRTFVEVITDDMVELADR